MAVKTKKFTPWSTLGNMLGRPPSWLPPEDQQRWQAYEKYDQLYWNDPTQYALRVLEDEEPIYIPNARIIVDTTCQWLMKGLRIVPKGQGDLHGDSGKAKGSDSGVEDATDDQSPLEAFLRRERFFSKFHLNKQAGVTRGDSAFHIWADDEREEGSRISIDTLHPGQAIKVYSDEDPDVLVRVHIVRIFKGYDPEDPEQEYLDKLTYHKIGPGHDDYKGGPIRIAREQAIFSLEEEWFGPTPKKVKDVLQYEELDERITTIPVYWFPNLEWESQDYGSSELRGLEFLDWAVSQAATDTQMSLGLEGLGVYATDGGRPVDEGGKETDWEVSPGKVMEVPAGSYFRRVEGVGSITPMMDQMKYVESKMFAAAGLTDVALGQVDVAVAQSGIALAIKFMPTLAKVEQRDIAYMEILVQMFHNLTAWFDVYDPTFQIGSVEITIDQDKLPKDKVAILNELNNMLDRKIISRKFYRQEMAHLGWDIPDNMDQEILEEAKVAAEIAALSAPPGLQENATQAAAGKKVITNANGGNNESVDNAGNQSNNESRPNESSGTEA